MFASSSDIKHIAQAMLAVQGKVSGVARDAKADAGRRVYKYATLEAVIDAIRPACVEAGIVLLQAPSLDPQSGVVQVETRLVHAASGEWVSCTSACAANAGDAQAVGSAQTYMRRYGLMALLGLAPEDDDGQAARGAPTGQPAAPRTAPVTSQRDKVLARIASMRESLNLQPHDYSNHTDAELVVVGTDLRRKLDAQNGGTNG